MPFRFYLFVLWRFFKNIFVVVTAPIWFPVATTIMMLLFLIEWAQDVYAAARRDWVRKQ